MRIPIPLLLAALVATSAVVVYIYITVSPILSYDPTYVTFNGTHYIVNTGSTVPYGIFPPMVVTYTSVSSVSTVTRIASYSSTDPWYSCPAAGCDIHPTILNFDNMPKATKYTLRTNVFIVRLNGKPDVVVLWENAKNSLGSTIPYGHPFIRATTVGGVSIFRWATKAEVTGYEAEICSYIQVANAGIIVTRDGQYYSCYSKRWSSGYYWTTVGTISIAVGPLGYYNRYDFTGFSVITHPTYWAASAYIAGKPLS